MIKWHYIKAGQAKEYRGTPDEPYYLKAYLPIANKAMKYLSVAQAMKGMSKDPSTQVGAVALGINYSVLAASYNGFPRGVFDNEVLLNDREQKYPRIIHAEANLVAAAALEGVSLRDSTVLLTSLHPCSQCAGLLIQAGVRVIIAPLSPDNERWDGSNAIAYDMLRQANVTLLLYSEENE